MEKFKTQIMEGKKIKTYGEAIAEVEKILARFGDGTLDVDTLAAEVRRATELIRMCKERLGKAEKELNEIFSRNADGGGNGRDEIMSNPSKI